MLRMCMARCMRVYVSARHCKRGGTVGWINGMPIIAPLMVHEGEVLLYTICNSFANSGSRSLPGIMWAAAHRHAWKAQEQGRACALLRAVVHPRRYSS